MFAQTCYQANNEVIFRIVQKKYKSEMLLRKSNEHPLQIAKEIEEKRRRDAEEEAEAIRRRDERYLRSTIIFRFLRYNFANVLIL